MTSNLMAGAPYTHRERESDRQTHRHTDTHTDGNVKLDGWCPLYTHTHTHTHTYRLRP